MTITPSPTDDFLTTLQHPIMPSAQMPNKRCCGCFKHIYDHFDNPKPWPCFWADEYWTDRNIYPYLTKNTKDWTIEDSWLTPYALPPRGDGLPMQAHSLVFKLRLIPPPWTIQFTYKIEYATWTDPRYTPGYGNFVYGGTASIATRYGGGITMFRGSNLGDINQNFYITYGVGSITPATQGYILTENNYSSNLSEIYLRYSLDSNHEFTIDWKIDGSRPDILATDGMGNPLGYPLPFTAEYLTPSIFNRWMVDECAVLRIAPTRGPYKIDYIEAMITPGIL